MMFHNSSSTESLTLLTAKVVGTLHEAELTWASQHAEGQNMMPMPNKAQPKDETELKILHKGDGHNSGKHGMMRNKTGKKKPHNKQSQSYYRFESSQTQPCFPPQHRFH